MSTETKCNGNEKKTKTKYFGKKNKNFIAGQKQYKNLKRTFIFGQLVT